MCLESCEIDAVACSTSLTEDSSGMEMDFMVTVTMVPDALALKKGIGWVWLRTFIPPLGWDRLKCTVCSLFDDHYTALCLLSVYFSVHLFACFLSLFISWPVFFSSVSPLVWFGYSSLLGFRIFSITLLHLITFILENTLHVNCLAEENALI